MIVDDRGQRPSEGLGVARIIVYQELRNMIVIACFYIGITILGEWTTIEHWTSCTEGVGEYFRAITIKVAGLALIAHSICTLSTFTFLSVLLYQHNWWSFQCIFGLCWTSVLTWSIWEHSWGSCYSPKWSAVSRNSSRTKILREFWNIFCILHQYSQIYRPDMHRQHHNPWWNEKFHVASIWSSIFPQTLTSLIEADLARRSYLLLDNSCIRSLVGESWWLQPQSECFHGSGLALVPPTLVPYFCRYSSKLHIDTNICMSITNSWLISLHSNILNMFIRIMRHFQLWSSRFNCYNHHVREFPDTILNHSDQKQTSFT